ncbi:MAG: hypothetical protein HYR55_16910 [Acidobacteria bacterium]|nr:hypothetical protein [Acidobacteriota bacterium]MBI3655784.1 hypothetical protein [Acidobacteriota bacterium]
MTPELQEKFLNEHIPYKLTAIDLCYHVSLFLEHHGNAHVTTITVSHPMMVIQAPTVTVFSNAVVEHGFMSCRAMLESLGVGLNPTQDQLAEYRHQRCTTLTLRHFGLDLLTVERVLAHLSDDVTAINGLVQTIRAGHKGGAHLTIGSERLQPAPLAAGCRATRSLVDHFLYEALGRAAPTALFTVGNGTAT